MRNPHKRKSLIQGNPLVESYFHWVLAEFWLIFVWGRVFQNSENIMCSSLFKGSTLANTFYVAVTTKIAGW